MPSKNQYLYTMNDEKLRLMMLDIDGILTRYEATPTDVLAAAQALAVSAIGDLVNKSAVHADNNVQCSARPKGACYQRDARMFNVQSTEALHRAADGIADQIRAALHARINEGHRTDW